MSNQNQTLFDKLNIQDAFRSVENDNFLRKSRLIRYSILLLTLLITTFFFTYHLGTDLFRGTTDNITEGQLWNSKAVVADRTFPLLKSRINYNKEIDKVKSEVLPNFKVIQGTNDRVVQDVLAILDTNTLFRNYNFDEKIKKSYINNFGSLKKDIKERINYFYSKGIIDKDKSDINNSSIVVINDKYEQTILNLDNVFELEDVEQKIRMLLRNNVEEQIYSDVSSQVLKLIEPNLIFSSNLTNERIKLAVNNIPKNEEIIAKGQILVNKNDRLSEKQVRVLKSYFSSIDASDDNVSSFFLLLGSLGHASLILLLLIFYLKNIRTRIFTDNFQLIILCIIFVVTALLSWISLEVNSTFSIEYLIFVPAFSMMTAIIFDSRTAFYFTVISALLIAGIRGNDYSTALFHLFAGAVASYTVRDIQNRTQMFKSIFFIFLGYSFPLIIFFFERSSSLSELLNNTILISTNSVLSPLITFGLIFILERFSNFSTDLQLKEYDNPDHPLLKKMSDIAPGTYQHSLNVAMLAERSAIAIGANPVYCKVSSLYHDIGKMKKPEYFVENQIDIGNKHDQMSPKKSAKIIIDHVNYGVELAKQYKLPNRMVDIILMHHGTTLVQYFYNKAIEEAKDPSMVSEDDYRYPGPKPRTREAALIMLCDTAEAISHIKNYTSDELDAILQKVILDRISDGQFDESGISVKELQIVKFTIVKNLIGMGHKRIQYKEAPKSIKTDYEI